MKWESATVHKSGVQEILEIGMARVHKVERFKK